MKSIIKLKKQDGASVVLALLLLMVVSLMCTALFYMIGSAIRNAGQGKDREQVRLLAQSLSANVQAQIAEKGESSLAIYLEENIGSRQSGWGYYNPDEVFNSNKAAVTRTFTEQVNTDDGLTADVSIAIYWTSDSETEMKMEYAGGKRAMYITTTVTLKGQNGDQEAAVTAVYDYNEQSIDDETYWWVYRGGI